MKIRSWSKENCTVTGPIIISLSNNLKSFGVILFWIPHKLASILNYFACFYNSQTSNCNLFWSVPSSNKTEAQAVPAMLVIQISLIRDTNGVVSWEHNSAFIWNNGSCFSFSIRNCTKVRRDYSLICSFFLSSQCIFQSVQVALEKAPKWSSENSFLTA